MKPNPKLSRTIAAILSGSALGVGTAHADTPAAPDASEADTIQTVTVTAQRRSESIQEVPITIQAMTGAQLNQMSITTFDQVLKYLPNVTFGGSGPGMGNIFMRGMSSGFAGNQSSATFASFP